MIGSVEEDVSRAKRIMMLARRTRDLGRISRLEIRKHWKSVAVPRVPKPNWNLQRLLCLASQSARSLRLGGLELLSEADVPHPGRLPCLWEGNIRRPRRLRLPVPAGDRVLTFSKTFR